MGAEVVSASHRILNVNLPDYQRMCLRHIIFSIKPTHTRAGNSYKAAACVFVLLHSICRCMEYHRLVMYTEKQLDQYFQHISYPPEKHSQDALELLRSLQRYHQVRVPFENLTLHYSRHRTLSLDLDDLFEKIVVHSRGGYCMEVNAFFGAVLKSLGFCVFSCGGRVNGRAGYSGW